MFQLFSDQIEAKRNHLSILFLQIECKNQQNVQKTPLTQARALQLVKDVFVSAAERDIYTGDCITVNLITKDGITNEEFRLRKD